MFKAMFGGIVASALASIVYIVLSIAMLMRGYTPPPGAIEVGFDLRTLLFKRPSYWLIILLALAFALGFWWVFRRASKLSTTGSR